MTRQWFREVALICVGGLVAIAVLAPQVAVADRHVDRLVRNERTLARRCTFTAAGGAVCSPHTFQIDRTTTTTVAK